jgi:hypothetical protein
VFLNINTLLPGLFKLLKNLLGLIDATGVALQLHPTLSRRHFHA